MDILVGGLTLWAVIQIVGLVAFFWLLVSGLNKMGD